jgi:LacI family transcriptional regulator
MQATTIKQIAKELGIHPSTVSRALSGHPHIAEKTREKVVRMAGQLNYEPNLWAQNLVGSKTNLIGCLVLELTNPFYIPMIRAIQDIVDKQDYITFIGESRRNLEIEKQVIERFRRIRASGVIITPVLSNLDHIKNLEKEGVPVVAAGRTVKELDSVNVDNIKSGMVAGQHFIDRGFKTIGYIQSGDQFNFPERDRLIGLEKILSEHGQNLNVLYTVGNNGIVGGEKAGKIWLAEKKRPKAVFCSNDMVAMGFIQYLVRSGVQIPDDVAVLGHDDVSFADRFIIPLSTVAFPKYKMGQHAINLLLKRISHPEYPYEPQTIRLKPELVLRKSCI